MPQQAMSKARSGATTKVAYTQKAKSHQTLPAAGPPRGEPMGGMQKASISASEDGHDIDKLCQLLRHPQ